LWREALDLLAHLADEDVHRAVAVDHRVAPNVLVDLVALEHPAARFREQVKQLELAPREVDALAADERLELIGADLELAGQQRTVLGGGRRRALAPAEHSFHARDHLLWMAGLRDPVVRADAQAAHALCHARAA